MTREKNGVPIITSETGNQAGIEDRRKEATGKRKRQFWESSKGWQSVEIGDGLLIGSAEGGFSGLEEFTPPQGIMIQGGAGVENLYEVLDTKTPQGTGKSSGKKGRKPEIEKTDSKSVEVLQKKLAAAEAEAKRLKKQLGEQGLRKRRKADSKVSDLHPTKSERPKELEEKALNHKQRKQLQRAEYKAAKRDALKREKQALRKEQKKNEKASAKATPSPAEALFHGQTEDSLPEDIVAWKPYNLDPLIEEALSGMQFSAPTPIQQECLPAAIRDRRDMIGAAQTGSGKTLAFGLPILQALMDEKREKMVSPADTEGEESGRIEDTDRHLQALILAPTRELAIQVSDHLQAIAKPCGIWVAPIVGGIAVEKQERYLRNKPEIVVATPGRLWELMRDGADFLTNMDHLSFLVLDEADRMVQQGHYEELTSILGFLPTQQAGEPEGGNETSDEESRHKDIEMRDSELPRRRLQTFVFSATLTLPEGLRRRLKRGGGGSSGSVTLENLMEKISFGHKPKIVDLSSKSRLADKVSEAYLECTEDDRDEKLYYLLIQHSGRTLIFANAISMVRRLAAILKLLQLPVVAMHSSMQQRQRLKALERFRKSDSAIMVATDVAARGLDIPEIACVVHYQLPAAADVYVHRCGRTGRAAAEGISVALVVSKEVARFTALWKAMNRESPPVFPLDYNLLPGARKRIRLATKLDELLRSSSKQSAEKTWEQQMAEAAGIILSDDEVDPEDLQASQTAHGANAKLLQQELAQLLQEPLQPKYSQRFFAGQPSAALAVRDTTAKDAEHHQLDSNAVSQAVVHAKRLATARAVGSAATAAKAKKQRKQKVLQSDSEALKKKAQDAGQRAAARKKGEIQKTSIGRSRFVVIPGAVARESGGKTALDALRHKILTSKGPVSDAV